MTINSIIYAALSAVLPNTFAVELPPDPQFPAIVFDSETTPESGWCAGGAAAYSQSEVTVIALGRNLADVDSLLAQIRAALEGVAGFMEEIGSGNSDYEPDPDAYAMFLIVRIRTRNI